MPQDRESAAAGNLFGHATAPRTAAALGATMVGSGSYEAQYNGQRVVIKCAGWNTSSVGVTHRVLESLDVVRAAFQHQDGSFDVYSLRADEYRRHMRDSRSSGAAGRVGLVAKKTFTEHGTRVQIVRGV